MNMHWVVVGTGNISKRHRENIKTLWPDAVVTSLITHRNISEKDYSQNHTDYVSDTPQNILKQNPEAVIIATPASSHIEEAFFWLTHNIPVFIEKPLSTSVKDAEKIKSVLNNATSTVGYVLRFYSVLKELKKIICDNKFGSVISLQAHVGSFLPDWRPQLDYKKSVSANAKLGGGVLLELSHEIDYVIWLLGVPEKISATVKNSGKLGIEVEDEADLKLSFKNNISADIHLDFLQKPAQRYCKVVFENAIVTADLINGTLVVEKEECINETYNFQNPSSNAPYLEQLKDFYQAIQENRPPFITVKDGFNVLSVIDASKNMQ